MKCQENRQMIYTYLDGELSTYEERTLYSHMATCDSCQLDMERARNIHQLLEKTIKHVEPPQGFADKVVANLPSRTNTGSAELDTKDFLKEETAAEEKDKGPKRIFPFRNRWIGIAAGLVFAFLAVSSLNQVAQISIDPKAEDGYFVWITPKDKDVLLEEHGDKSQQSDNHVKETPTVNDGEPKDVQEGNNTTDDPDNSKDNMVPDGSNSDSQSNAGADDKQNPDSNEEESTNKDEPSHVVASNFPDDVETFETEEPIVLFNATGSVTLTPLADNAGSATWNSTGTSLLYTVENDGKYEVHESQINGDSKRASGSYSTAGRWSPNKDYVVYTQVVDGRSTIWVEGRGEKKNLTPETEDQGNGSHWAYNPVWSNKGEIAFLTRRFGGTEIMVVDLDGNSRRVTSTGGKKEAISWSPDGTQIAYYKSWEEKGSKLGEIVVVSADGGKGKAVTPSIKTTGMAAAWSPDGKLLAVNAAGEQGGVWIASSTGSKWERQLTTKGGGKTIKWSPDGQKIAFNDSQGVFHILIWRSAQANINMVQVTPMAGQMIDAYIEWARNSQEILIEQPVSGSEQRKVWVATLPKSITAY